jgi:putative transposase
MGMPRIARVVVPGYAHHVTQRGNRREQVFFSDGDRHRYLQLLLQYSQEHGLTTLAYCLMTNHVHLVCVPERAD